MVLDKKHLWINNQMVETDNYSILRSPYSGEALAEVASAKLSDADLAIEAAARATQEMARMPAHLRSSILGNLARLLESRSDEAVRILAQEASKPIRAAEAEIARTVQTYLISAEEAKRIGGERIALDAVPGGEGRFAYTTFEPLGVVGAITPYNFPFNLVAHKVGPAIAAGNTVVLKPATQTPLSALFLAELAKEAGFPDGAFNVVTGSGRTIGDRIVNDPRVRKITFTGSPEVGMTIRNRAGLKRVTLELGSNSALIVDNGVDLDKIIPRCVFGSFSYQGQVCISIQRIFVHEHIYNDFTERFVRETQALKLGDPLDPSTDIGAMISEVEAHRVIEWIEEAQAEGAVIACGGIREGGVMHPTVLLNASTKLKVSCQEAFAPLVVISPFQSMDQAFDRVNDSRYGLQAGIYTNDYGTAMAAAERLHVGGVVINDIPTFRVDHMPYGGVKESGMGREGVKYAIQEMMEMKLVVMNRSGV